MAQRCQQEAGSTGPSPGRWQVAWPMHPISVPSGLTQGQSWPPSSAWFLTSSSPGPWATTPHNLLPKAWLALILLSALLPGPEPPWLQAALGAAEKEQCMTQGSMLLLWVLLLAIVPFLCAFPRILTGGGRPACQEGDQAGWWCRAKGEPKVPAPGAGLGMVAWSDLEALKGDDPYIKGLCCPRTWPEGWETSGTDPCNPSDYSAMPSELQGGRSGKPKALSHLGSQASDKSARDIGLVSWRVRLACLWFTLAVAGVRGENRSMAPGTPSRHSQRDHNCPTAYVVQV